MPIPVGQVRDSVNATVAIYSEAELSLVRLLTRRIEAGIDRPGWAVKKLAELAAVRRAVQLVAEQTARRGGRAARAAVALGYRAGNDQAVVDLAEALAGDVGPVARSADFRNGNAIQALGNAIVNDLRPVHSAILPTAESAYRHAVSGAAARQLTGTADIRHAAQAAWAALVDRGVTGFTDRRGRTWQLHTYVEMAVRTAVTRAHVQGLLDGFVASGITLVYVPDRPRECELCRPFEARVLSLDGIVGERADVNQRTGSRTLVTVTATVEQARETGLFHPGCRHTLRPFLPGRTTLRPAQAADPEGAAAETRQRQLERHLRHWRIREEAALTPEARRSALARVQAWNLEMERHLREHPALRRLRYRERPGAGFTARDRSDSAWVAPAGGRRR